MRLSRLSLLAAGIGTALLCQAHPAAAQTVVYSNLGNPPAMSINSSRGDIRFDRWYSQSFTAGPTDQKFHSLDLGLRGVGMEGLVYAALVSDSGNSPIGGSGIEVFQFQAPASTGNTALVTLNSVAKPTLVAGQRYWVSLFADSSPGSGQVSWMDNLQGDQGTWQLQGAGTYNPTQAKGAMRIWATDESASAVPEPASFVLFLPALAAIAVAARKRRAVEAPVSETA